MKGSLLSLYSVREYHIDVAQRRICVPERSEKVRIVLYLYLGSLQSSVQSIQCNVHPPNHTGTLYSLPGYLIFYGECRTGIMIYVHVIMRTPKATESADSTQELEL